MKSEIFKINDLSWDFDKTIDLPTITVSVVDMYGYKYLELTVIQSNEKILKNFSFLKGIEAITIESSSFTIEENEPLCVTMENIIEEATELAQKKFRRVAMSVVSYLKEKGHTEQEIKDILLGKDRS